MSDISGQLIKDSFSYILQADTGTGYVYRVNGNVPVNPIFSSGLTVFSAFTFVDGNQQNGYVLTSDGNGNSRWASVSGTSVSSVTASTGLSGNSTTGAITLINTAPDKTVVITGGTNIQIISDYPNFGINFTGTTSSSGDYLPLSGGTVTGATIFQSGLTANTISGGTIYGNGSNLTNVVNSITASTGLSGNSTTGTITIINTAPDQTVTISGGTGISTGGTYPNFSIVNTAPDQTVTITGGTNIEITGAYPDFGVNFTGTTSGEYLPLSGGTVTGGTIFQSGLTANTISATTYFNVSPNFQYEIHVSQVDGSDTTGNGTLLNPVATITKALTLLTGSRKTIIVHPGGYTENVTVANGNTTIATSELTGANSVLYGTLTINTAGTGARISGLKMSNLVISGTAQAYISNCTVDTNVTKSSSGYVEIINTEMQCISGIQISGSGTTIINGNKNVGVSVSNASAQVIIKGCNSVVTPSASAGNLAIVDCIVTALGGNAITITGALTNLTLANSQVLVQAGNNVAPISVAGIYSIFNTVYDKANSSLTGTNTNSVDYFQFINADKFITQGGTSLQYVMGDGSLSNGFTGGTVSGATNFTNGLTANTISATTYYNLPSQSGTGISAFSYNQSTGLLTITKNDTNTLTAGTFSYVTATTLSAANVLSVASNGTSATTTTINAVTGGTYSNGTITLSGTGGVNGNTITGFPTSLTGDYLPLSGGTVTGNTIFQSGLTANTLNVTGNALLSGLTAATISATTYFNLPTDIRVTGGTYTNGTATFTNNTGGTFNVTGFAIGGGGGQIFYLNLSQSQNGDRFLSTTASTASEQTSGVTIGRSVTGSIASFQTTPLNISLIPGGIWSFYLHSYKQDNNSSFDIFVEVYKITSGGSQTLLFATDPAPVTTNSPNPSMQLTDGYFSGTSLNVSDGVVAVVKATNTGNQTHIITLVTEGSQHYSYVVSTIPTQQGLTCETLSGCSIIQTINTDISNKFDKSGGTVSGATNFISGLTANTISATTYQNLPSQSGTGVSAFAYNGSTGILTITKNDTNTLTAGTFNYVTATTLSSANVLSVASNGGSPTTTTINAVTGGSYSSGTITLSGTGSVNGNTITGLNTGTVTSITSGTGMSFSNITTSGSVSIDTTKVPYYSGGFSSGFAKYNGSSWVFDNSTYLTTAITSLGGLTGTTQTFANDTNVTMVSSGTTHTLTWSGTLADARIASSTNWNTAYTNRITTLTTTGSSGSSTLSSNTLNIPTYTLSGLGGQPLSTNLSSLSGLIYASTSFVKMTSTGTFGLDTNTYLTSAVTATTLSAANVLSVTSSNGSPTTTTINAVTGGTYSNGTITLSGTGSVNGTQITGLSTGSTGGAGITWNNSTTATTATTNNGYVGTATTLTTITLPSTAAFGSIIEVVGTGTGLWRISQSTASQSIKFGITGTTTGTGGYLSATSQYDCVKLLCTSADTTFVVTSAIGNIFYI
jgi:hypothetical protein